MNVLKGDLTSRGTPAQLQAVEAASSTRPNVWPALLVVALLAVGLWAYHVIAAVMISPDSALFIEYARQLRVEPAAALRTHDQHPLFPAAILLLRQIATRFWNQDAAGWIFAGRLVGLAGYLGAAFASYWLAARAYERRVGVVTAALVVLIPDMSHLGADVLTDTLHLSLYLTALAALATGLQAERPARWLLASAALSALAFLTRPEGGAVLLIGLVFVLTGRSWRFRRRVMLALGMAAVFATVSSPYQLTTGRLIKKKSLPQLLQFGLRDAQAARDSKDLQDTIASGELGICYAGLSRQQLAIPLNVLYQWGRATRVVYAIPALIALFIARPRRGPGRLLAAAAALHALLLCALQSSYGYLDRRHALLLAALAMPLAAAAIYQLALRLRSAIRPSLTLPAIIATCALLTAPWLLSPVNHGSEHVRAAAIWFAETPSDALLIGHRRMHRVALCADRAFSEWPWYEGRVSDLADFLKLHARPTTYVAIDTRLMTTPPRPPQFMDDLQRELGAQLELAFSAPAPPGEAPTEIRIYAYHASPQP